MAAVSSAILEMRRTKGYLSLLTRALIMASYVRKRPPSSRAIGSVTSVLEADTKKSGQESRSPSKTTLEEKLEAKASRADRADFSGPSLGELSREERHKLLYGE
jgi:hypothetical protein